MAAIATIKIRPHRRLGLNTTPTICAAQGSADTFVQGDPVEFDSGYVGAADLTAIASVGDCVDVSAGIIGFADMDATSSSTAKVNVTPALPGMMFKGQLITSETTPALVTIAQTHLGATAAITKLDTDSVYAVDIGATAVAAEPMVKIVELIDPVGTVGGEVGFIVLQTGRTLDVVAS
jgi:hypothetical protein